jgi:hypothetical protein
MRPGSRFERLVAALLAAALVAGCSGGTTEVHSSTAISTEVPPVDTGSNSVPPTSSGPTTTAAAPLPLVDVPAPPPPAQVSGSNPQEQAASLAATVGDTTDPIGGWLAVYDALGIPVLGADGSGIGTTGDDPIGPSYSMVWMLSDAAAKTSGLPLSDLARAYVDDDAQSAGLGDLLLSDLRAAVVSDDPQVALFGSFVFQRSRHIGPGIDMLDPAVPATDVYVDVATAQLISWVALRGMAAVGAAGTTSILGFRAVAAPATRQLRTDVPCSEFAGDETTTFWTNFLANKVGAGLELPGMTSALKGLIEKVAELNPHILDVDKVSKATALAKKANLVGGLLSLLMQVSSLTLDASQDPDPLQRNKLSSEGAGKSTVVTWAVRMDNGSLPDGSKKVACAATAILNFLGVGFSFPPEGALPGVDVTFKGHVGFGQGLDESGSFVTLDANELTKTTDQSGVTTTTVTGRAQKRDFPDSAKPVLREFSIDVAAQVEPENANSLFNVFFDGFTASDALGVGSGAIDIAKTLHWDLGEQTFRLSDWQAGWKIDQTLRAWHFTGIVCDTTKPFTLDAVLQADASGTYTITPSGDGPIQWTFAGFTDGGAFPLHSTGGGNIQTPQNAEAVVHLADSGPLIADIPGVGPSAIPLITLDEGDLVLVPLETEECSGG